MDSMLPLLAMYKTTEIVMRNKVTITTAPSTVKEKKYDDNSTRSLNTTFVEHSNHNTYLHVWDFIPNKDVHNHYSKLTKTCNTGKSNRKTRL